MKDMIKKLVDIDERAKSYKEETLRQKADLEKEIEKEANLAYEKHITDAKSSAEAESKLVEENAEAAYKKNRDKNKASLDKLESVYSDNRDKWVDEIVNRVLA